MSPYLAVFNRFTARLRENPVLGPAVARGFYYLYVEAQYRVPKNLGPIAGFDDSYALAQNRTYGTERDAYREGFEHAV